MSKANKPEYPRCTKSAKQIGRTLRALRRLIESNANSDLILARIAYSVETALLWLTTNSQDNLAQDVVLEANILREELKANEQSH